MPFGWSGSGSDPSVGQGNEFLSIAGSSTSAKRKIAHSENGVVSMIRSHVMR